jgi:hypothetical protein
LGLEPKRFELAAPFCGRIAKSLDTDTAGQATFDGCAHKIRRKECERDGHIDLAYAAPLTSCDLFNVGYRPGPDLIKPASTSCDGVDEASSAFDPGRANLAFGNTVRGGGFVWLSWMAAFATESTAKARRPFQMFRPGLLK